MSLKDRVKDDRFRVFLNHDHFASWHYWNGVKFQCVADEEAVLKRKNNNVVDVGWDNNYSGAVIYCAKEEFPGKAIPNEHGFFDKKPMKILSVNEDMGMLSIQLTSNDPREVNQTDAVY